jgi:hypothetical protein
MIEFFHFRSVWRSYLDYPGLRIEVEVLTLDPLLHRANAQNPEIGRFRSWEPSTQARISCGIRHAVSIYKEQIEESIAIVAEHLARQKPHMANYIRRMIFKKKIRPNADQQYVKHILTSQLAAAIVAFYQQDCIVIRNDTDLPFITSAYSPRLPGRLGRSDNATPCVDPSSTFPEKPFKVPVSRFLPLAEQVRILLEIRIEVAVPLSANRNWSSAIQLSHTGIIRVPHGVVTATGHPSMRLIAALSPIAPQRLSLPPSLPGAGTSAARSLAAPSTGPVISRQATLAVGCLGT